MNGHAYRRAPAAVRLAALVDVTGDCQLFMGTTDPDGYGSFFMGGTKVRAHRAAWLLAYGAIPKGSQVLHSCDEPRCVRLDHLWLGTHADNMADMARKRRAARGDHNSRGLRYPDALVREVLARAGSGLTAAAIERLVGIPQRTVRDWIRGIYRA